MHIGFITVGDPHRLTGGYLYHARVFERLRAQGIQITEIVASEAALSAQLNQAGAFCASFDPSRFEVVVVDALARAVCAPCIDDWRAERPVVAMVHELPSAAEARGNELALEEPLLRADLLITVSAHGQALLEQRGVAASRIRIVSPGRDRLEAANHHTIKHESQQPDRSPIGERSSALQVLCVAQWIPRKGIVTLVEAWGRSPRPNALLMLIGETNADPAYAAQVQVAIAQTRPDAPIVVRGAVDDAALNAAYRAADLFVLPSIFEGYGMVYAEALSYGVPIIACATGPMPDIIGDAGRLVTPGDAHDLAAALDLLMNDSPLREQLAHNAYVRATKLSTWEDTARNFARVLHEAVHGSAGG